MNIHSPASFWTESELERLREMHSQGLPTKTMALEFGRTTLSVKSKLFKLGMKRPTDYKSPQAHAWPEEQVAKLRELHAEGLASSEISKAIGRSEEAVTHKLHKLGLRRPAALVSARAASVMLMVSQSGGWSDAELAQLLDLNNQGLSASDISARMGKSRNAILGKLFRLRGGRTGNRKVSVAKIPRGVKLPPVRRFNYTDQPALPPISLADGAGIAITDLQTGMCKWPIGDPKQSDFRFCGHPQHEGKPYCTAHCAVAYAPPKVRLRDAYNYRRAA